jgi:hypothetical protein
MIIKTPPPLYEISTRNWKIKHFLTDMFDVYGIKDYSLITATTWEKNPVEIYPVKNKAYEKSILGLNKLESIDDLVLHQFLRLETELNDGIPVPLDFQNDEGERFNLTRNEPIMRNFEDGFSYLYLVKEEKPEKSYKLFKGFLDEGVNGLCISCIPPDQLNTSYGLNSDNVIWLCNTEGENNINPKDLSKLLNKINNFIVENNNSVILLDGLEYLISHNGLKKVLDILNELNSQINKDSMFILPIHPKALRKNDLDRLEKSIVH